MARYLVFFLFVSSFSGQTNSNVIEKSVTINPENGPLKLRIVFEEPKNQQEPCSSGNCQKNACATGNCFSDTTTTTPLPPTQGQSIVRKIANYQSPIKVIRIPSYSPSYGCFAPPCRPRLSFYPPPPPCFGCRNAHRRFFYPPPPPFGMMRSMGGGSHVAIPDMIFKDGMAIRTPIRVPSSYQNGNPVFNNGK